MKLTPTTHEGSTATQDAPISSDGPSISSKESALVTVGATEHPSFRTPQWTQTEYGHDNRLDARDVTDFERARLLAEYLDAISEVCPDPRLMPLGSDGKFGAFVTNGVGLDSSESRRMLHSPQEAIEAVEGGHRGFCLYAGKEDHNTENIVLVDHDDMTAFPKDTLPETLTVCSGSGRGIHETFLNDGTVENANGKDEYDGGGEIRADNEMCVLPGSIHESGGIYHVVDDVSVATLSNTDIPKGLRPSQPSSDTTDVDVDPRVNWDRGETNAKGYTLDECRAKDDTLDQLLSTDVREDLDSKTHDDSEIDGDLVAKLRYHHFSHQQITSIWKTHRPRAKLSRTDYVRRTLQNRATHNDRWTYYNDVTDYVPFIPNVCAEVSDFPQHCGRKPTATQGFPFRVGLRNKSPWNYDGLAQKDVWKRTTRTIARALNEGAHTVIEALPSSGKSTGLIKAAATTEVPVTVLTSRHDLYDDYQERCEEHDLSHKELPSFHNDCPTANGEYGREWETAVRSAYRSGLSGNEIHRYDEQLFGEPLPCDHGHECPYKQHWDFNPEAYDVLIGNYVHAYNTTMTTDRTVVFDEFPSSNLVEEFDMEEVALMTGDFLKKHEEIPFDNHKEVIEHRSDDERRRKAEQWFLDNEDGDNGIERDTTARINESLGKNQSRAGDAKWNEKKHTRNHPLAPLLTYALINGQDLGNGWEYSNLELGFASDYGRLSPCVSALNWDSRTLSVLRPPQLTEADGVICLDGTPELALWRTVVDNDLTKQQVLSEDERCEYLTDVLGYQIVQTTDRANHYASGNYVHPEQDGVLFEGARQETGVQPSLISTKNAVAKYDETDVLTPIDDVDGIEDCRASTNVEWYGNLKGTNDYEDERVGIVSGSQHFGDDYVKKWCAFNNERVEHIDGTTGIDREYSTALGNAVQTNMREHNVFQAIMRFERGSGSGALVFVNTAAFPDWVPVEHEGSVETLSDGMKEVIAAIDRCDGTEFTRTDLGVDLSKRQIKRNLKQLSEWGQLGSEPRSGRATLWSINDGFRETCFDNKPNV